jgi:hypothetical protein
MSKEVFNIHAEYISSGIVGVYSEWLNSNSKLTLEELTLIAKEAMLSRWEKNNK